MNWKKFRNFTLDAVTSSKVDYDPFAHIYLSQVFDSNLYDLLLEHWPQHGWVNNTAHLNQSRQQHAFADYNSFWKLFYTEILSHDQIIDAIYKKFQLNVPCAWVNATLWKDTGEYIVGPHIDQFRIDIAWQTFIQVDNSNIGTELYYNEQGVLAKKIPSINNSGWLMINDAYSWHGLSKQTSFSKRYSLMTRFMNG